MAQEGAYTRDRWHRYNFLTKVFFSRYDFWSNFGNLFFDGTTRLNDMRMYNGLKKKSHGYHTRVFFLLQTLRPWSIKTNAVLLVMGLDFCPMTTNFTTIGFYQNCCVGVRLYSQQKLNTCISISVTQRRIAHEEIKLTFSNFGIEKLWMNDFFVKAIYSLFCNKITFTQIVHIAFDSFHIFYDIYLY